jgi:flavin-dependent dehydrogenase
MEEALKSAELNCELSIETAIGDVARSSWDVVVIGAGPAGALTARQSALAGLRTLVVDAKRFPREKVCGGYLNSRALGVLERMKLSGLLSGRATVNTLELALGHRRAQFCLPPGRVICRSTFDADLLASARASGAHVMTGVQAAVEPAVDDGARQVVLFDGRSRDRVRARVVVCADGLSRTSLRQFPQLSNAAAANSRVGIGGVVEGDVHGFSAERIVMVVSRHGYVGISRIDDFRLNVAAAIDPGVLSQRVPVEIVADMLASADVPRPAPLHLANWRGTPPLTIRPSCVAFERVFVIGDAGGYMEPFTGEGIATALESAAAVTPLIVLAANGWLPSMATCWESVHRQIVYARQHTCRQLAWILRRPWAAIAAIEVSRALPGVAARLIANTTRTYRYELSDGN